MRSHARTDRNLFLEAVLKTPSGKCIRQAAIHEEIHEHIDECKKRGEKYCGILAPWGHGKSESVIIGTTLHEIGLNPNIRAYIVCNTDENATSRVASITKYILYDDDYHRIFPNVKPGQNEDWSKHKIIVKRDSYAKDGTLQSWGITTSGVGGRCDLLLFDDIVDQRNALSNPAMRPQIKDMFNNVWLSRLEPDGMAVYIATIWHQDDNTSELLKNKEWKFLQMKISEDFERIECDSAFKGTYDIPLWDYWNKKHLIQRMNLIGQRAFDRGFRQKALSDEDRTFPSSETIFKPNLDLGVVRNDWPRVMGIDPFGQWVVLFTVAYNPIHKTRVPIEVIRVKSQPAHTKELIIDAFRRHKHQIVVCENNASQEAIVQWIGTDQAGKQIPLIPFCTGKQKADPAFGLPSLEVEFNNGLWIVPTKHIDANDHKHGVNVWKSELFNHPGHETEDTVMASWFAREGVRYLAQEEEPQQEIYDEEDVGIEPVQIGAY